MEIHPKAKLGAGILAMLVSTAAFAADKVQITGSTSVLLPKPNQVLEDSKRSRFSDGPSGRSEYEGGLPPMGPVFNTSPQAEKKFKDALDKKKNWIFVNPYEMQFDSKTAEFLKGEKGTGLFNHRLMQGDEKGILERYMNEKKSEREFDSNNPDKESSSDRHDDRKDHSLTVNPNGLEGAAGPNAESPKLDRGLMLPPALEKKSILLSDRNGLQERLERSPFAESGFEMGDKPREREVFTREERQARDAELGQIYQPRLPSGPRAFEPVGGLDPLTSSIDSTRQEATPFSGRRSDQLFNVGRAEPSAVGGRNSPIFSGPSVAGPGSGLDAPTSRSSFDFGSKAPASSPFSPSASVAPAAPASAALSAPFVLPRPQRKF